MEKKEALVMALQSLWANKLRSILTMLGVVIAVASVIAVVTLINGANQYIATKVNNQGADVFTISQQPAFTTSYKEYLQYQKRKIISMEQYRALQAECTSCKQVGALQSSVGRIKFKAQSSTDTQVRGYTMLMPEMQNLNIVEGRGFTQADDEHGAHVALIGYDIYENLMKFEDPYRQGDPRGRRAVHRDRDGREAGQDAGAEPGQLGGGAADDLPEDLWHGEDADHLCQAGSGADAMELASDQARLIMRELRHDRPNQQDSFTLATSDALAGLFSQISNSIGGVAIAIAALSLVVGGVVIMNIMLVSVTERTREIGVRKALGAKRGDMLMQFLMESGLLSLFGGVMGVGLGVVIAKLVAHYGGFPAAIALWSVLVGLFVALSTGIFFGVYPARKAADLDPIVALRSEF